MKHGFRIIALGLAMAAGASLTAASAQETEQAHGRDAMSFERIDADGDGKLTPDEMAAHRKARLMGFDLDGDALIDADELREGMTRHGAKRVEMRITRILNHHDANGDGKIGADEMARGRGGRMFRKVDTDGDGALSEAEFEAIRTARHGMQ